MKNSIEYMHNIWIQTMKTFSEESFANIYLSINLSIWILTSIFFRIFVCLFVCLSLSNLFFFFRLFVFVLLNFPQISVCRISKLYNLGFFSLPPTEL